MKDFYIYHAIPIGFTLLMAGALDAFIGLGLLILRKKDAAKPLLFTGMFLLFLGLIVLAIAIILGGLHIFDA